MSSYLFAFVGDGVSIVSEGKLSVVSFSLFVSLVKSSSDLKKKIPSETGKRKGFILT